jgi:hypothetical protein
VNRLLFTFLLNLADIITAFGDLETLKLFRIMNVISLNLKFGAD